MFGSCRCLSAFLCDRRALRAQWQQSLIDATQKKCFRVLLFISFSLFSSMQYCHSSLSFSISQLTVILCECTTDCSPSIVCVNRKYMASYFFISVPPVDDWNIPFLFCSILRFNSGEKKLSTDNHKWHLVNSFYSFSHFFLVSFHAAFVCLQSSRFILENTVISDIFSDQKKEMKRNFDNRRVVIVKRHRYKSINSFTLSLELFLFWRDHFIFKSHLKGPRKLKQN